MGLWALDAVLYFWHALGLVLGVGVLAIALRKVIPPRVGLGSAGGLALLIFIAKGFLGLGPADGLTAIHRHGDKLIVMDKIMVPGGKTSKPQPLDRINLFDRETGTRIYRVSPHGQRYRAVGTVEDRLFLDRDCTVLRLADGEKVFDADAARVIAPAGAQQLGDVNTCQQGGLEFLAQDGRKVRVDPFRGRMLQAGESVATPTPLAKPEVHPVLAMEAEGEGVRKRVAGQSYLDPRWVADDVLLSYGTTEHREFTLTAFGADGKIRWRFEPETLAGRRLLSRARQLDAITVADGRLYFNSGDLLVCVAVADGRVIWTALL